MSRSALQTIFVLFALGLGVGAATTALLVRPAPGLASSDPSAALVPVALPTWAWRESDTPPALAPDTVSPALAAWRGLRSPDGFPAPYPARALATVLATNPAIPQGREALTNILFSWGTDRPDEAIAWLNQLADPDLRLSLLERSGNSYYTDNPEKSLPLALALPASQNRGQSITRLLTAWAKIDPTATLAWIGAQNDPAVTAAAPSVQGAILGTIARDEPATALAEWATLTDPRAKQAAIDPIVEAWGQSDPAAALRWATAQKENAGYSYSYSGLVAAWAHKDPEAALRWAEAATLQQKAQGQNHYPSPLAFVGGDWNDQAPRAQTADLYAKIQDPALRLETITNHLQEWRAQDPAAAQTWLETQTTLSPEQTAALLAPAK